MKNIENPKTVILVLGYGTIATPEVCNYYIQAAIQAKKINSDCRVITCGGYTDKSNNSLSEAELGEKIMKKTSPDLNIFREDLSFTTLENLRQSEMLMRKWAMQEDWRANKVIIYCHPIRVGKVVWLARIVFSGWLIFVRFRLEVVGIEEFSYSKLEKWKQWLIKAPIEIWIALWSMPEISVTGDRFRSWFRRK